MNNSLHQQLLNDLLVESFEGLDRYDRELLAMENGNTSPDVLNSIFRTIHTLKGTSGCLGLTRIEKLAHTGENLLDLVRNGKLTINSEMVSTLLRMSDALRGMLQAIEREGNEGDADFSALVSELDAHAAGKKPAVTTPAAAASLPTPPPPIEAPAAGFGLFDEEPSPSATPHAKPAAEPVGFGLFEDEPAVSPSAAAPVEESGFGLFTDEPAAPVVKPVAAVTPAAAKPAPKPAKVEGANNGPSIADSAIRVDVGQLDRLMNLVGELVLARNQIVQNPTARHDSNLSAAAQRLNAITTELQEGVMKTRMQPIENVWAKFPRIVRDVSGELGKKVRLEMEGKETELDRTIIEAIKDPLTHIIRNAIDHGLESPEKRAAAGKPEEGLLCLRAYHESSQVNIEIADDGAGLKVDRIKAKALEKGLITAEQANRMTEREAFGLVFLPGFSTAEKITNVSGRGVGMDVVKTNIEKIGGTVDVQSTPGHGAVFKLKIPLTLAIVPALLVKTAGARFAIPRPNLVELVSVQGEAAKKAVESVYGAPVFRLRGHLLPLVFLREALAMPAGSREQLNIVVLQADHRQFGLVVDEVCDTEEIVVKPLGKHFKGLPMYAGATILGDGAVSLILDILGLAQHTRALNEAAAQHEVEHALKGTASSGGPLVQLLIFSLPGRDRLALPLDQAARLEEFPVEAIERTGDEEAVQYRGNILPLVRLQALLPGTQALAETEALQVIVYQHGAQQVGLVVGEIVDIIETEVVLQSRSRVPGLRGSGIIQGKITEFVDPQALLQLARLAEPVA